MTPALVKSWASWGPTTASTTVRCIQLGRLFPSSLSPATNTTCNRSLHPSLHSVCVLRRTYVIFGRIECDSQNRMSKHSPVKTQPLPVGGSSNGLPEVSTGTADAELAGDADQDLPGVSTLDGCGGSKCHDDQSNVQAPAPKLCILEICRCREVSRRKYRTAFNWRRDVGFNVEAKNLGRWVGHDLETLKGIRTPYQCHQIIHPSKVILLNANLCHPEISEVQWRPTCRSNNRRAVSSVPWNRISPGLPVSVGAQQEKGIVSNHPPPHLSLSTI